MPPVYPVIDETVRTGDQYYYEGSDANELIIGGPSLSAVFAGAGDDVLIIGRNVTDARGDEGADWFRGPMTDLPGVINDFGDADRIVVAGAALTASDLRVTYNVDETQGGLASVFLSISDGDRTESIFLEAFTGAAPYLDRIFTVEQVGIDSHITLAPLENLTLTGTDGNDMIGGQAGDDTLTGLAGDDTLIGTWGSDRLIGGAGNDTYRINAHSTIVEQANGGIDTIVGYLTDLPAHIENLEFEVPTGYYYSGPSNVIARGNALDNVMTGTGSYYNGLIGLGGDDTLIGREGRDSLYGGDGDDALHASQGSDDQGAQDTLQGGAGADTLVGDSGADKLVGGPATGDLRDEIYGQGGNDFVDGGGGNDLLYGGTGNDTMLGGFGADFVAGQQGDDLISGGALSDAVFGNDGDDFLNGGYGFDRLNGGAGADTFYHLGVVGHGSDWVQDFTVQDRLEYGGTATAAQFQVNLATTTGAGGAAQEAFVIHRPTGQILWALVDGGAADSIVMQVGDQSFDLLG